MLRKICGRTGKSLPFESQIDMMLDSMLETDNSSSGSSSVKGLNILFSAFPSSKKVKEIERDNRLL